MNKIKIWECFASIQGEGSTIGTPAYFLRTAGCNLKCPWCDTKYAIDSNSTVSEWAPIEKLAEDIDKTKLETVVYTGGEPLLQWRGLFELSKILPPKVSSVIIETNGTRFPPLEEALRKMFFVVSPKFYNEHAYDPDIIERMLKKYYNQVELKIVFLQHADMERTYVLLTKLHENKIPMLKSITFQPGVHPNTKSHQSLHEQWLKAYEIYDEWRDRIPYKTKFIVQQHKAIWHPEARGV